MSSSYEDFYGMVASVFEALKKVQLKPPSEWELDSIIEPISEQLILKLSEPERLIANPTLAAPTNIRIFFNHTHDAIQNPIKLIAFAAFLIAIPIFTTIFVAMVTNVNIVLKVLGLPLSRNPVRASPLTVILLMVTLFGNIPLVDFFPGHSTQFQALLPIYPGHYHGVIARVLQFVALYEVFGLAVSAIFEMFQLFRRGRSHLAKLLQPASITSWLLTITGFALRMWFTRVSTDTATSPVQSGSTVWVWRNVVLRTEVQYQSPDEFKDDLFLWLAYFGTTFCLSSLLAHFALSPRQEVYQPVEPKIIKVIASSSIQTASAGCQTTVTAEDWVTKSSIAADVERVKAIQDVIDKDLANVTTFSSNWLSETEKASEYLKEQTLVWQNDHTALNTQTSALRGFRCTLEQHKEDGKKMRVLADQVAATVKRLEQVVAQHEKDYKERVQVHDDGYKEYQKQIEELIAQFPLLAKEPDEETAVSDETKGKQATEPDANLGPREVESHSVSANTPELQKSPKPLAEVQGASNLDIKNSSEPQPPSPPLSPPNPDDPDSSSDNANGEKKQEASTARPVGPTDGVPSAPKVVPMELAYSDSVNSSISADHALSIITASAAPVDGSNVIPETTSSASAEFSTEPEKTSDSETDAVNALARSDDERMEEIGTDIWSRVQKFKYRDAERFSVREDIISTRRHFTVQEIEKISALLMDFRDNAANDAQRAQVSSLLNAGFPHRIGLAIPYNLDLLSVFLDMAEYYKPPTRERIYTEFPPLPLVVASGVAPMRLCVTNGSRGRGCNFYVERLLCMSRDVVESAGAEVKEQLQMDLDRVAHNMTRLWGERKDTLMRVLPTEVAKSRCVWDVNLIARRLLENFGLLEFREFTTEGTNTDEYIPPTPVKTASIEPKSDETPSTEPVSAPEPALTPTQIVPCSEDLSVQTSPATEAVSVETTSPLASTESTSTQPESSETSPVEAPPVETIPIDPSSVLASTESALAGPTSIILPSVEAPPTPAPIDQALIEPTCNKTSSIETPQLQPPSAAAPIEQALTEPTCSETPIEAPPPSADVGIAQIEAICSEAPSIAVPPSSSPASVPACSEPSHPNPVAICLPNEPAQPHPTSPTEEEQFVSPSMTSSVSFDPPVAPSVKPRAPASRPFNLQTSFSSPTSPSAITPTRATPIKSSAPDWRFEALQDPTFLQQQPQRPTESTPHKSKPRKSQGGRGRARNGNA